jgi:phosphoserine phosphatase
MLRRATPMAGADRCMAELKGLGATISILSGGLKLLSRTLAERWGFDSHFANGLEHGPDGRLTGEGILEVPLRDKGGVLVNNVMAGGGFGPVITVGDSIVDISMFKRSDLAIAFRPKDERVTRRAQLVVDEPDLALVSCAVTDWLERHEGHSPPRVPQ